MRESDRGPVTSLFCAALLLSCISSRSQTYVPGQTYFGRSNYIEYIAGDLPFILSEPHGGALQPAEIPDRTYGTFTTDSNTEDLALKIRTEFQNLVGHVPHVIMCRIDRDKIDCNRDIVEGAQGNPEAEIAWNEFQNFIICSKTNTVARLGRGFYIDLHGHGHTNQQLELGYLLTSAELANSDATLNSSFYEDQSSIRTLSQQSPLTFPALLRGSNSFGGMIGAEWYPSVPSPGNPDPGSDPYFNGGYNTVQHSSVNGGNISGLQIESNYDNVRDTSANRTAFAQALARVMERYFAMHYGISLRECVPSVWDGGSGNWATAANWYDGALPVSTNHIVFAGAGGSVSHNLSTLTAANGVLGSMIFSNVAAGNYTISGNSFSVLRGITNNSSSSQTVNNNINMGGTQTFAANSGALTFGGNITNGGSQLRCMGDMTISGVISGNGGLSKAGVGSLFLSAINTYSGPTTNQSGMIEVNATSTFGNGAGLLVLAGGDINDRNTRSVAPISNPVLLTGSSTISGDGTLTNSLRILPFSANSITTLSGALTIRHIGTNAYASNNIFRVRLTGGGFNFTRPITVGFVGDLPSTLSQLESYNDAVAGDQTFSGSISGFGQLRRDATNVATAGRTILTGANSYSGGTIVNAGTLLVNNSLGSGTSSGFVAVSNNGTLGGSGIIAGLVTCSGIISPGQSAGLLTLGGGLDLSAGGTNLWQLAALDTAGEGANCDQIVLTGGNLALGGTSKLQLAFIGSATIPSATDPFWLTSHTWKIISVTGSASNVGPTRFPTILNGNFSTGTFTNFADADGNVMLAYHAIPAPAPAIQSIANSGPNEITISFTTITNRSYVLQTSTNLTAPVWLDLSINIAPANLLTLTNATGGDPMRFYRVIVVP